MRGKKRIYGALKQCLAILLCVIMLTPFVIIALNSVKTEAEAKRMRLSFPSGPWQWENFANVIERGNLVSSFGNSVLFAVVGTLGSTLLAAMAAFVLSRRRTRLNQAIYFFLVMGIVMPVNMVALLRVTQALRSINPPLTIILLYVTTNLPMALFVIHGFVGTVPRELDEAGLIDGATPPQLFFRIVLPLIRPVLVTVMLLVFTGIWNDFQFPLYILNNSANWPMPLAIYNFFGMYENKWHHIFADIVLTCLPAILVYLIAQRQIISGLISGAVKG